MKLVRPVRKAIVWVKSKVSVTKLLKRTYVQCTWKLILSMILV